MQIGGTPTDGKVLNDTVLAEPIRYHGTFVLVITRHDLLLVKIDVETGLGLLKIGNVEVVDKHIRKDDTKQHCMIHAAKVQLYS